MTYVVDAHESKLETTPDRIDVARWSTFQSPKWTVAAWLCLLGVTYLSYVSTLDGDPDFTSMLTARSRPRQPLAGTIIYFANLYNLIQLERFLDGFRPNRTNPKSVYHASAPGASLESATLVCGTSLCCWLLHGLACLIHLFLIRTWSDTWMVWFTMWEALHVQAQLSSIYFLKNKKTNMVANWSIRQYFFPLQKWILLYYIDGYTHWHGCIHLTLASIVVEANKVC
jgi:hypothetical protein